MEGTNNNLLQFLPVLPSKDLLGSIKGHGKTSHNEVSKSKANQEIVVDPTESSVQYDTENYKKVGEYGDHNDEDENECFEPM